MGPIAPKGHIGPRADREIVYSCDVHLGQGLLALWARALRPRVLGAIIGHLAHRASRPNRPDRVLALLIGPEVR